MEWTVEHEEQGSRGAFFIMAQGRRIAEMTYRRASAAVVIIDHTEVEPALRGKKVARSLLDAAVKWARESRTKLGATCSYAVVQFAKDASLKDVLA
jgi:predicted GNAT family acetyltransferase